MPAVPAPSPRSTALIADSTPSIGEHRASPCRPRPSRRGRPRSPAAAAPGRGTAARPAGPARRRSSSGQQSIIRPASDARREHARRCAGPIGDGASGPVALIAAPPSSAAATSSTTQPRRGPSTLVTCGANDGDSASTRRGGPLETTSPSASTTTSSATCATNSTSWVATRTARPSAARSRDDRARARPCRRSRGRGSARRAARTGGRAVSTIDEREREPLALGQVARVEVLVDAGREPVEQAAAGAGARPRRRVGGGALVGDGLEVEQVGGGLRHQPDVRTPLGGRERGRVVAVDVDACPSAACPTPGAPRAGSTCPSRCGPSAR